MKVAGTRDGFGGGASEGSPAGPMELEEPQDMA